MLLFYEFIVGIASQESTSIIFQNNSDKLVTVFWIDYEEERVPYYDLAPDKEYTQSTFVTHKWIVVDVNTDKIIARLEGIPDTQVVEVLPNEVKIGGKVWNEEKVKETVSP